MTSPPTPTCHRCGQDVVSGARFCLHCGADVSAEQAGLATAHVAPVSPPPARKTPHSYALELLRNETLGEYEVLGELGRGGMAAVFLAHDISLDRKVAIKVMSPALMDQGMAERFKREARTAASLNHPHIIPIFAVRDRDPVLFFVMKFIAGQSLDPIIKEHGQLPIPMVQTIVSQAGSALGYAHRRGVVHRDVKPANIMLDEEGWAMVTDFGIAKVSASQGLTMTGVTVGTPAYMSPEQCLAKEVTGASDQYSLGVVAYEMLTGVQPFKADSVMALMWAHFNEAPKPIADLRPDCPTPLADAVMRMLEKDPEKRWPSMDDLVAAIGAKPLAHDDPIRLKMVDLALTGSSAKLASEYKTPTSPVPPVKRTTKPKAVEAPTTPIPPVRQPTAPATPASPTPAPPASTPPAGVDVGAPTVVTPPAATPARRPPPRTTAVGAGKPAPAKGRSWLWLGLGGVAVAGVAAALMLGGGGESAAPTDSLPPAGPAGPGGPAAVAAVQVAPGAITLHPAEKAQLQVVLRDAENRVLAGRSVRWTSSDPAVVGISATGEVTASRVGRSTITAESEAARGTATVTVEEAAPVVGPSVASVSLTPSSASLDVGGSITLRAVLRDAGRATLRDRRIVWSSSSPAVVVDEGRVTAVSPGTATVTATSEGRSGRATITVAPPGVASVVIDPASARLQVGESTAFAALVRDARGATLRRDVRWESSNGRVASVSDGRVRAVAPGSATITASSEGQSASASVTVTQPAAPPPAPGPTVDPEAERLNNLRDIGIALNNLVRALDSRDMAALRRAYPGISAEEERRWRGLLEERSISDFGVIIRDLVPPRIDGDRAEALFGLAISFKAAGQSQSQIQQYAADLERQGGTWRIVRLRPR